MTVPEREAVIYGPDSLFCTFKNWCSTRGSGFIPAFFADGPGADKKPSGDLPDSLIYLLPLKLWEIRVWIEGNNSKPGNVPSEIWKKMDEGVELAENICYFFVLACLFNEKKNEFVKKALFCFLNCLHILYFYY